LIELAFYALKEDPGHAVTSSWSVA
jgi:hypothetical protein